MKNIHILPTDKPSRLCIDNSCNELNYSEIEGLNSKHITNQNIYITSDEEIKEGDWFYNPFINEVQINCNSNGCNKIILTTDQDLIKDGVQAIDDTFLEWFVKNPNCEEVGVIKIDVEQPKPLYPNGNHKGERVWIEQYKIIIPQEEPKDVALGYKTSIVPQMLNLKEELKKETIEEVLDEHYSHKDDAGDRVFYESGVKSILKWQADRMYSEEEVKHIISEALQSALVTVDLEQWFEQFKKK